MKRQFKNFTELLVQQWKPMTIGSVFALLFGYLFWEFQFPQAKFLLYKSYDIPFIWDIQDAPKDVIVIYMDDDSHRELAQPYTAPWNRALHAMLLDRLTEEGVRAVIFDVVFSDPGPNPEIDRQFAEAIERNGKVVLAADLIPTGGINDEESEMMIPPFVDFDDVTADIGFPQLNQDEDFEVRKHHHRSADIPLDPWKYSMTWAAAKLLGAPVTQNDENRTRELYINYYGKPKQLTSYSYFEVFKGTRIPKGTFKDKVVFVGAHVLTHLSGERKDEFRNPYSAFDFLVSTSDFMAGVEVHATILQNLLREDWYERVDPKIELAIIIFCGVLFGGALSLVRPLAAVLLAILGLVGLVFCVRYLFWTQDVWFPWLIIAAIQIPIGLTTSVVYNSVRLYVQGKLLEQSLGLYLSPRLVRKFLKDKDKKFFRPSAKKQTVSIVFTDIASFTSISEGMDSDVLANSMNQYFQTMVDQCIHPHDGTVDKFIGDAILAFWNAPDPQPDHAYRACLAALKLRNQKVTISGDKNLYTRIGLHTGEANVGNFGSETKVNYTALGEAINLASRMEGLNKYLGTQVLITGETLRQTESKLITRKLGMFQLKGFGKSVEVHELLGAKDDGEDDTQIWRKPFDEGVTAFVHRDFDTAIQAFENTIDLKPNDGPSNYLISHCRELKASSPPDDWNGEIELKEK